jgi:hypothetical protein
MEKHAARLLAPIIAGQDICLMADRHTFPGVKITLSFGYLTVFCDFVTMSGFEPPTLGL